MNRKRWKAVVAAVLVLALLFLALHVVLEAEHDCHGDNCAICVQIHRCMDLLRQLTLTLALALAAAFARGVFSARRKHCARAHRQSSLISLKVKLSN